MKMDVTISQHARIRAQERYGLVLTREEVFQLSSQILTGNQLAVEFTPRGMDMVCQLRGFPVRLIYRPLENMVVSFLPFEEKTMSALTITETPMNKIGKTLTNVRETMEYGRFKPNHANRPIDAREVDRIKQSIIKRGFLKSKPVIVDNEGYIKDGHHRLAAAQELNKPVCYVVDDSLTLNDVREVAAIGRRWSVSDFIGSYSKSGYYAYLRLNTVCEELGLSHSVALRLINQAEGHRFAEFTTLFRNGDLKFGIEQETHLKMVQSVVREVEAFTKNKLRSEKFYRAVARLITMEGFDYKWFKSRLEKVGYTIEERPRVADCLKELVEVYNYHTRTEKRLPL